MAKGQKRGDKTTPKKLLTTKKSQKYNFLSFFFSKDTASTEIYTLSLHDALPIFVIGSKHITLNATGGGFLTASKQFRHGATSKSRSNTASNSTKHKSPHLSGWRQIISLIT